MNNYTRNYLSFGVGTIGRDMVYSLISMYLTYYLATILELSVATYAWVTAIIVASRVFDAVNDPVMGVIVDNTKTRWGKYKPWIAIGAFASGILTILLFTDFGLQEGAFIAMFALLYILWGISYTANDISYWSMMPALSVDRKKRENIGAFARICANIGLFAVVVGIVPITEGLGESTGSMKTAYFIFAIGVVVILWIGQAITVFGVKEPKLAVEQEPTRLKDLMNALFKNDQLLYVAISMVTFMIGYVTTTSFGLFYFEFIFGNIDMYAVFALILGVSQLLALALFPLFSQRFNRQQLFLFGFVLVVIGYIIFFFSPMNIAFIAVAGVILFFGQAFIQLLMLVFLADTIEYGHWKLGKRNEAVTFSIQPFINKMGGAIASGIVGYTVIVTGIKEANSAADITAEGALLFKVIMLLFPVVLIIISYFIYKAKFKIDDEMYTKIMSDLKERGQINTEV